MIPRLAHQCGQAARGCEYRHPKVNLGACRRVATSHTCLRARGPRLRARSSLLHVVTQEAADMPERGGVPSLI